MATSLVQVTLKLRLELWIILDPTGRAAEHLLALLFHGVCISQPVQEVGLSAGHGFRSFSQPPLKVKSAGQNGRSSPCASTLNSSPILQAMGEDGRAVALDMLIEPDAGAGLGHD